MAQFESQENILRFWEIQEKRIDYACNIRHWLNPKNWNITIGYSDYLYSPIPPYSFKEKKRAANLNILCNYHIIYNTRPIEYSIDPESGLYEFLPPKREQNKALLKNIIASKQMYFMDEKVDLVWATAEELEDVRIYYVDAKSIATISQETREKVYGNHVTNAKPPGHAINDVVGVAVPNERFIEAIAQFATYGPSDLIYYNKWKINNNKEKTIRSKRSLNNFDILSDEYLKYNFKAFELQKNMMYVLLELAFPDQNGDCLALIELFQQENLLKYKLLISVGINVIGNPFIAFSKRLEDRVNELYPFSLNSIFDISDNKIKGSALFFYSAKGTINQFNFKPINSSLTLRTQSYEQILDPQYLVQKFRGYNVHEIDKSEEKWDEKDWLKQLVRLYFSEQWVYLNNNDVNTASGINRDKLFLDKLRKELKLSKGPFKENLNRLIKKAEDDKSFFLVRRGYKYGQYKRIIGSDSSYVYLFNNNTQLLTRMPMFAFWFNVYQNELWDDVFEQTKWIIPASKLVVWGSTGIIVGALFLEYLVVENFLVGAKRYLIKKVEEVVISKLIEERFNALINRLYLLLFDTILSLFPSISKNNILELPYRFLKGLLHGYTHDAINSLLNNAISIANLEPKSYKAYKACEKINATINKVDEKITLIKPLLDNQLTETLLSNFSQAFTDAIISIMAILHNLYFLDYEQVEIYLDVYTELTGAEKITKSDWDQLRFNHLLETIKSYDKSIKEAQTTVKDIYSDAKHHIDFFEKAVQHAELLMLTNIATGGLLIALFVGAMGSFLKNTGKWGSIVVLPGLSSGILIGAAVNKDVRDGVINGLNTLIDSRLGKITPDKMELLGQFIGQIWGGISLNKTVFGKNETWTGRVKSSDNAGSFFTKSFLVNETKISPVLPILKLILFKYTYLIERFIKTSKQEWEKLSTEIEDILNENEFSDIIKEDKSFTIGKLLQIIAVINNVISNWLKELSKIPELTSNITKFSERLKSLSPQQIPTFNQMRNGGKSIEDWGEYAAETFLFIFLSQLNTSLIGLTKSIELMAKPVNPDSTPGISIIFLLQIIGLQINDKEIKHILERDFENVFGKMSK